MHLEQKMVGVGEKNEKEKDGTRFEQAYLMQRMPRKKHKSRFVVFRKPNDPHKRTLLTPFWLPSSISFLKSKNKENLTRMNSSFKGMHFQHLSTKFKFHCIKHHHRER